MIRSSASNSAKKRRWYQFSLRTLFAVTTLAAIVVCALPPLVAWLFPPKPETEFDKLIRLIQETITGPNQETPLTLIHGQGQIVNEEPEE